MEPRPRSRPSGPRPGLALLGALALLAAASCLVTSEPLGRLGGGVAVYRLSGMPAPSEPPSPAFESLTVADYQNALRRVVVTYDTWTSLLQSEPVPLFSESMIAAVAPLLAREIPGLTPDQRVELRFKGVRRGQSVQVQVHGEGAFFVFEFLALSKDFSQLSSDNLEIPNQANLVPQVGQTVEDAREPVVLREPVRPQAAISAQARRRVGDMIEAARRNGEISGEAAASLAEILAELPRVEIPPFEEHFQKRKTLAKALKLGLFTAEEFEERIQRLEELLRNPGPEKGGQSWLPARLREVGRALEEGTIEPEEAGRLEAILRDNASLTFDRLADFLHKRKTLGRARSQGLLTREEFESRLERLTKELSR